MDADEPDEADDPGWFLVDPATEGTPAARWLYEYADGTVVDDEGRVQVETPPVHLVAAPAVEARPRRTRSRRAPRRSSLSSTRSPSPSPSRTPSPRAPVGRACRDHGASEPEPETSPRRSLGPRAPRGRPGRDHGAPRAEPQPGATPEPQPSGGPPSRCGRRDPARRPRGREPPLARAAAGPSRGSGPGARRRRGAAAVVIGVLVGRGTDRGDATASQAASRFDPPDAVPLDSEYVSSSRVLPSGAVVVDHWVRTSRPFTDVRLEAPRPRLRGGRVATARRCASRRRRGRRSGPGTLGTGRGRRTTAGRPPRCTSTTCSPGWCGAA